MSNSEIPKASYRYLGRSGLRISVPILGGMSFGNEKWNPASLSEEKALPLLKAAWDSGVTTWDLANMYSNGLTETIAGKFIKQNNIPRKKMTIITKIRWLVDKDEPTNITTLFKPELKNTRDYVNQGGLSRAAIYNQIEDSLERLGTDYIDLLILHGQDINAPFEETMSTLNDLVRAGKVRYVGATNFKLWRIVQMNTMARERGWVGFSCIQVEHSLVYRTEEDDALEYCIKEGLGVLAYGPLAQGFLARPYGVQTPRSKFYEGTIAEMKFRKSDIEIINRVGTIAEKRKLTRAQVALLWSLSKITSPVCGFNSPGRLLEAVAITGKNLTEEDIKYLEEPYEPQALKWYSTDHI